MEQYYGFVEFFVVILFGLCWLVLEWQGRRLDRKRDAERAKQATTTPTTTTPQP